MGVPDWVQVKKKYHSRVEPRETVEMRTYNVLACFIIF